MECWLVNKQLFLQRCILRNDVYFLAEEYTTCSNYYLFIQPLQLKKFSAYTLLIYLTPSLKIADLEI